MDYLLLHGGVLPRTDLKAAEKLVICYLAFRQGKNTACWPVMEVIAVELGLSLSTVKRSINKLVYSGYLIKRTAHGGKFQSNSYIVKTEYLQSGSPVPQLDQAPTVRQENSLFRAGEKQRDYLRQKLLRRVEGARATQHRATSPPRIEHRVIPTPDDCKAGWNRWRELRGLPPLDAAKRNDDEQSKSNIAASG